MTDTHKNHTLTDHQMLIANHDRQRLCTTLTTEIAELKRLLACYNHGDKVGVTERDYDKFITTKPVNPADIPYLILGGVYLVLLINGAMILSDVFLSTDFFQMRLIRSVALLTLATGLLFLPLAGHKMYKQMVHNEQDGDKLVLQNGQVRYYLHKAYLLQLLTAKQQRLSALG